jgi:hypothetical protein
LREALEAGVAELELAAELREMEAGLGPGLTSWKASLVAGPRSTALSTKG